MTSDTDAAEVKRSPVEVFKENSGGLYGPIAEDLASPKKPFSEESIQLLKHHGSYQQDNRDSRKERAKQKLGKEYSMMLRTKFPGGNISAEQYIWCDKFSDTYGQRDLRVTSRQDFQFHGVLKGNFRPLIKNLNELAKISTLGGCGDVVRNTVAIPVADIDPRYTTLGVDILAMAHRISDHFMPATKSYYDLWLNDEKVTVGEGGALTYAADYKSPVEEDPIYGKLYLPRKFKIGIATDFDNSIDVYTQDAGVIVVTENGKAVGYEILAGGGLGFTHKKEETYARAGSHLAFVSTEDEVIEILENIVKVQRDFGGRANRKHARLKYLIDDNGLDWFRSKVEEYAGHPWPAARNVKPSAQPDYLGWHKQAQEGLNYVGVWIENGRIKDFDNSFQFRTGLRAIIEKFGCDVRLTSHHNVVLGNIKDQDVDAIKAMLDAHKIPTNQSISAVRRMEMACPALPLCGLALSEAERALPDIIKGIEDGGHGDAEVIIRMGGCPNNCTRTSTAEIGIVGRGREQYALYLGGNYNGTQIGTEFVPIVKIEQVVPAVNHLLAAWKSGRNQGEGFGIWVQRVGTEHVKADFEAAGILG